MIFNDNIFIQDMSKSDTKTKKGKLHNLGVQSAGAKDRKDSCKRRKLSRPKLQQPTKSKGTKYLVLPKSKAYYSPHTLFSQELICKSIQWR